MFSSRKYNRSSTGRGIKLSMWTSYLILTLYPAHSKVGKGNLVLRHSVPHVPPHSGGIACSVAELNALLCLDTRKINLNKYSNSSSGDQTHNQQLLRSALCPCAITIIIIIILRIYLLNNYVTKLRQISDTNMSIYYVGRVLVI